MPMTIVSDLLNSVVEVASLSIAPNAAALTKAIFPVFSAALLLYVCFIAYEIMYSHREVVMNEVTKTVMSLAVVSVFTYNGNYYVQYVIPFVMNAGTDLAAAVTGVDNPANVIDSMWDDLLRKIDLYLATAQGQVSLTSAKSWAVLITAYLIAMLAYLAGLVIITLTAIYLCITTFMVGLLLSVGTIFISFAVFPSTRAMFTSWCGFCLNYILLNVLYVISFGYLGKLIENVASSNDLLSSLAGVAKLLVIAFLSYSLLPQISVMVSSLTGGVGINGLSGTIAKDAKSMFNGAKSAAKGLSKAKAAVADLKRNGIRGG